MAVLGSDSINARLVDLHPHCIKELRHSFSVLHQLTLQQLAGILEAMDQKRLEKHESDKQVHAVITNQQQLLRLLGPTGHLSDTQLEDIAKKRGGIIASRIQSVLRIRRMRKKGVGS